MIYQGTSTATTGTSTQIQTSTYNDNYDDNAYVGYMYGSAGANSYSATHANTNNSTIKGVLDTWYQNNLRNRADDLDGNAGFCNDRTRYYGSGTGTNGTYYSARYRLYTNKAPI